MAIIIALQQRSETAQSLASKLEVSTRTIFRDMQALSEIGIPLYAITGPAGGYRMMEGYQLPPLQFDTKEALTMLFALNTLTKLKDTPFKQARWTVMDKIRASLPSSLLERVEPMLKHVEMDVPIRSHETPLLEELFAYTSESSWIRVHYRSERHEQWINMQPKRVYTAHGFWYCEAYSLQHNEMRTFRVDRFNYLERSAKPEQEKSTVVESVAIEKQSDETIPIKAKLTYRGSLFAEQDHHVGQFVKHIDENEWQLKFDCPISEWEWAVSFFFTLGLDAEVIDPPELKSELFEQASQLSLRYKPK
ncbi:WYL domain-containing protein [Paenibacillus sp. GSMTC-2017]|nr:WYL domain-containing protein [Paenibacillus sp. GSMTC-2017]MBH5317635.1 WYL domain-containing protein [Paenibacillus sp. GSMTC-2017]